MTEPNFWKVKEVSNKVGACGIHAYDVGEEWALMFNQNGLYLFLGGEPIKISQEIQPVVNLINWNFGHTIVVKDDLANKRILICVPIKTPNKFMPKFPVNANPTTPNVILMCSYRDVNNAAELAGAAPVHNTYTGTLRSFDMVRKWSYWNIPTPYVDGVIRTDTTEPLFFCNGAGNSKIYKLDDFTRNDDGLPINSYYRTYGFPRPDAAQAFGLGQHRLLAQFMSLNIRGDGSLNMTIFPDNLDTPSPDVLPPITLADPDPLGDAMFGVNDTGNRFFLEVGTNAVCEWFELSRVVLTVAKDPWAPTTGNR